MYESLQRSVAAFLYRKRAHHYHCARACPGHLRRIYRFVFGSRRLFAFACALFDIVGVCCPPPRWLPFLLLSWAFFVLLVVGLCVRPAVALVLADTSAAILGLLLRVASRGRRAVRVTTEFSGLGTVHGCGGHTVLNAGFFFSDP